MKISLFRQMAVLAIAAGVGCLNARAGDTGPDGSHTALHNTAHVLGRDKDPLNVLPEYLHPGGANADGIIAILIGLLLPAVQDRDTRPAPLPSNDSISAEVHDQRAHRSPRACRANGARSCCEVSNLNHTLRGHRA